VFQRGQEASLVHQVSGVAGPAFGHRAAAKHADARGAVDRRHLPNARRGARGVVVLRVMPDATVVHDVVELDHAIVGRAQQALLLRRRRLRLERRDQVVQRPYIVERSR